MPYYKPTVETIGGGGGGVTIDVEYPIDDGNVESGTFSIIGPAPAGSTVPYAQVGFSSGSRFDSAPKPVLRGIPTNTFRQVEYLPIDYSTDPCDEFSFYVTEYSEARDRIVYTGENLEESLNAEYTGCCYKPGPNEGDPPVQYSEPNLGQKRTLDMTLESIGWDASGLATWASQPSDFYHMDCILGAATVGAIVRSETFTVTFNKMEPQIRIAAPHMDDDFVVTMTNSNGTVVTIDKDTVGAQSITCTYPETVTISLSGQFSKKLFADETWEYYFEKFDPITGDPYSYTINPDHLAFDLDTSFERTFDEVQETSPAVITHDGTDPLYGDLIPNTGSENIVIQSDSITSDDFTTRTATSDITKELPFDPNDFIDAFRINQENKSGIGTGSGNVVPDLSVEIPSGSKILKYESDRTPRTAGLAVLDADGNTEKIVDPNDPGRYINNPDFDSSTASTTRPGHQDITLHFTVTSSVSPAGGTPVPWSLTPPLPGYAVGDLVTRGGNTYTVLTPGMPSLGSPPAGIPPDTGPSGTGLFTDNGGMQYNYVPYNIVGLSSYGAGDFTTTLYVMNDELLGFARLQELLDLQDDIRTKTS